MNLLNASPRVVFKGKSLAFGKTRCFPDNQSLKNASAPSLWRKRLLVFGWVNQLPKKASSHFSGLSASFHFGKPALPTQTLPLAQTLKNGAW